MRCRRNDAAGLVGCSLALSAFSRACSSPAFRSGRPPSGQALACASSAGAALPFARPVRRRVSPGVWRAPHPSRRPVSTASAPVLLRAAAADRVWRRPREPQVPRLEASPARWRRDRQPALRPVLPDRRAQPAARRLRQRPSPRHRPRSCRPSATTSTAAPASAVSCSSAGAVSLAATGVASPSLLHSPSTSTVTASARAANCSASMTAVSGAGLVASPAGLARVGGHAVRAWRVVPAGFADRFRRSNSGVRERQACVRCAGAGPVLGAARGSRRSDARVARSGLPSRAQPCRRRVVDQRIERAGGLARRRPRTAGRRLGAQGLLDGRIGRNVGQGITSSDARSG